MQPAVSSASFLRPPRYRAVIRRISQYLRQEGRADSMVEKNKNQTAAERAQAAEKLSGRRCAKCGQEVKLKDLMNVKQVSFAGGRRDVVSYHRACYNS